MINNILIDPNVVRSIIEADQDAPRATAFAVIQREVGLQAIYAALSGPDDIFHVPVTMIEAVYSQATDEPDCIYVDEEARLSRYDEDHPWWTMSGHPSPISGRGLVCGADENGDDIEPQGIDILWLVTNVRFGWRDIELAFDAGGEPILTQTRGVHVLDRWAQEGRIVPQHSMEAMGLATYGNFYGEE